MGEMAEYYSRAEECFQEEDQFDDIDRKVEMPRKVLQPTVNTASVKANKFYVGSHTALSRKWGHAKLEKAIEHASELADASGEDQFVVEIVRVVARRRVPLSIKKV